MKFITYRPTAAKPGQSRAGLLLGRYVVDLEQISKVWREEKGQLDQPPLPNSLLAYLELEDEGRRIMTEIAIWLKSFDEKGLCDDPRFVCFPSEETELLSPLPQPRSFRDFYAFEEHVKTARGRRGLEMVPQWYEFPVFYFSNHNAFLGPDAELERPAYTQWLDYELEVACVIGKTGRNVKPEEAHEYIAGFTVLNDWSARDVQREEVKVGLGPAKGKDFATSMGPYLLTLDELEDVRDGDRWKLEMTASVNGRELSRGNFGAIYFSFGELIARASDGVTLRPGEVIGSGTVGTGCILELGTEVHRWLEPGDVVELSIERLGVLRNKVVESRE
ncbi:MAG TPA: fumarylacetoacetate hydrolase family protein [Bacilli bacterium]|nr:fumarylacetoacetate hydrolase family protein [Bacilli bacterium]